MKQQLNRSSGCSIITSPPQFGHGLLTPPSSIFLWVLVLPQTNINGIGKPKHIFNRYKCGAICVCQTWWFLFYLLPSNSVNPASPRLHLELLVSSSFLLEGDALTHYAVNILHINDPWYNEDGLSPAINN
jgi:hypothetical protein